MAFWCQTWLRLYLVCPVLALLLFRGIFVITDEDTFLLTISQYYDYKALIKIGKCLIKHKKRKEKGGEHNT